MAGRALSPDNRERLRSYSPAFVCPTYFSDFVEAMTRPREPGPLTLEDYIRQWDRFTVYELVAYAEKCAVPYGWPFPLMEDDIDLALKAPERVW